MIVSEKHRYVYIAIPKAGSQSVSQWLVDHYSGSPVGYHHAWKVPPGYEDYFVFTVVRDPYERCFSAWWFRCMEPSRQRGNPMSGWSFDRFMRSVLFRKDASQSWDSGSTEARMTQKQFADLSGAQLAVRIESPDELGLLSFVGPEIPPLPRHNENRTRPDLPFHDYFSGEEEQLVWDYCAEDFAAFGYSRRPTL